MGRIASNRTNHTADATLGKAKPHTQTTTKPANRHLSIKH
ncbi:hypothetical protein SynMITS9220_02427 [Synechococcus sp. MIT S9220]|nr:hypothetical protein SynMITS9220_02427 [Synechococcus sp. MIT S9220]